MGDSEPSKIEADEVLILDSSTFIAEIGLMSRQGSALKHYLYRRGTKLVVLQAASEEYERHLMRRAKAKIERIEKSLEWLAQYFGKVMGWSAPDDKAIEKRAKALSSGQGIEAMFFAEPHSTNLRARQRNKFERPPSHKKSSLADCRIWEQCLVLLAEHDVIFVSGDKDFRGHRKQDKLHPQLRAEADEVGNSQCLIFHATMESLLSELKSEIQPIPDEAIFEFVYREIADSVRELQTNSNCRPTSSGTIKQARFTTEAPGVIEVRLEVNDIWESMEGAESLPFELSGACQYNLSDSTLTDLKASVVRLTTTGPDGSSRSVKGSWVSVGALSISTGPPPVEAQQGVLT